MTTTTFRKAALMGGNPNVRNYHRNFDTIFPKGPGPIIVDAEIIGGEEEKEPVIGEKTICPHCATLNFIRLDRWSCECKKCGYKD